MDRFFNGLAIMAIAGSAMGIILAKVLGAIRRSGIVEFLAYAFSTFFVCALAFGLGPRSKLEIGVWVSVAWGMCALIATIVVIATNDELRRKISKALRTWLTQTGRAR